MKRTIKAINLSDKDEFEKRVNKHLNEGWKIETTNCRFVNGELYDFHEKYQAILSLCE